MKIRENSMVWLLGREGVLWILGLAAMAACIAILSTPSRVRGAETEVKKVKGLSLSVDEFLGREVRDNQNQEAGDIEDLLINRNGEVTHIVVGIGGFFDFAEKRVAAPFDSFAITSKAYVMYQGTMDDLLDLPEFQYEYRRSQRRYPTPGYLRYGRYGYNYFPPGYTGAPPLGYGSRFGGVAPGYGPYPQGYRGFPPLGYGPGETWWGYRPGYGYGLYPQPYGRYYPAYPKSE